MAFEILLSGATGAVGRTIAGMIESDDHLSLAGRASRESFFEPDVDADVIVDFSHPELLDRVIGFATRHRLPLVTGTTGLARDLEARLREAAQSIPVCQAANFSVGVNLLVSLARQAAAALDEDFDIEVVETHHRRKLDAPSGTALWLGRSVAEARDRSLARSAVHDRSQEMRRRERGEIGFHALRGGDVAGEHTVHFLGDGERIELTHRSSDRRVFARGALAAARRLVDRDNGFYDFAELVLGRE